MVDGGWGVLQDPNIMWIDHLLDFRAGGLAARSPADPSENRGVGGFARPQRERCITIRIRTNRGTQGYVVSAPICLDPYGYVPFSLWTRKTSPHAHRSAGGKSRIGARDETTNSKVQVMTYPCYVRILKPSPPFIQKCDVKNSRMCCELEIQQPITVT